MVTIRQPSNYFAILFAAIIAIATVCDAFSVRPPVVSRTKRIQPPPTSKLSVTSNTDVAEGEEMVTMKSLDVVVKSRPLGVVLEELADGAGVFIAECDPDGAAYQAGIRDGDVLASLAGDETVLSATLDDSMALLGRAPLPLPVRIYRELEAEAPSSGRASGRGTVKMSPRRLPSAKKLMKASTSKSFWADPLMLGSAVLTVAMPIGIYVANEAFGK